MVGRLERLEVTDKEVEEVDRLEGSEIDEDQQTLFLYTNGYPEQIATRA